MHPFMFISIGNFFYAHMFSFTSMFDILYTILLCPYKFCLPRVVL